MGPLVLRVMTGAMMMSHGFSKMANLGASIKGFPDPTGFLGSAAAAILVILAEFFCSLGVLVGFKARIMAIPPFITMMVAFFIHHSADPFKAKELSLLYGVAFLSIILLGSGPLSLDAFLQKRGLSKGRN